MLLESSLETLAITNKYGWSHDVRQWRSQKFDLEGAVGHF